MPISRLLLCAVGLFGVGAVLFLTLRSPAASQEFQQITKDQYEEELRSAPYAGRLARAREVLLGTSDAEVAVKALRELRDVSKELGREDEALEAVEAFLAQEPEGSVLYQDAHYVKARLLFRSGETDAARALFAQGSTSGWTPYDREDPFEALKDTLYQSDVASYAVENCNRALTDEAWYEREGDYLKILGINLLWRARRSGETFAERDVLPNLGERTDAPHHRQAAKVVCMIADGRYAEARDEIGVLERQLAGVHSAAAGDTQGYFRANEKRNVPLYMAAVLLLEGRDLSGARAAMGDFYALNTDRAEYVRERLMRLVFTLEGGGASPYRRASAATSFLIDSGFTSDPSILSQFAPSSHLWILDHQLISLFHQRRWDEAVSVAEEMAAQYDPDDMAANNGLYTLGLIHLREGRPSEAEAAFQRQIAAETPARWERAAKAKLAETWIALEKPASEVLGLTANLLEQASPEEASFYGYGRSIHRAGRYAAQKSEG